MDITVLVDCRTRFGDDRRLVDEDVEADCARVMEDAVAEGWIDDVAASARFSID
jgi:hypothetical protein